MKKFMSDISHFWRYAIYSARAELKSEVANSYLNWIWWVLEPLCTMIVYVIVFQYMLQNKTDHFAVFVFIGIAAWGFFNKTLTASVKMVQANKSIISKVYLPKNIMILSNMMVNGFKMLISFVIVFVLMLIYKVPFTLQILNLVPLFLLLWVLSYGLATFLLHLGVFIEDMAYVVSILLRLLYFMTGIFYDVLTKVHNPVARHALVTYNPMCFLITQMRRCLLLGQGIDWKLYLVWLLIALLISILGTELIYKNENSYIKVV